MHYLAVFDGKTVGWHLASENLIVALVRDWPAVRPQRGTTEVRDVWWTYPGVAGNLEASTHRDGTCLYLSGGGNEVCATFAIWYRTLIPPAIELIFCDEGYESAFSLSAATTLNDVMEQLD